MAMAFFEEIQILHALLPIAAMGLGGNGAKGVSMTYNKGRRAVVVVHIWFQ